MTIGEQYNHEFIAVYSCIKSCHLLCMYKLQVQSASDVFQHWETGDILY